jgi:hypothetical protein
MWYLNSLDEVEISRLLGKKTEEIEFDYFDNEQPIDRQKYVTRLVSGEYNFLIIDQEEYNQLSAKEQLAEATTTCFLMSLKEEKARSLVYGIPLKEELMRNSSDSLKLIVSQLKQN